MSWKSILFYCLIGSMLLGALGLNVGSASDQTSLRSIEVSQIREQASKSTLDMTTKADGTVFHVEKEPLLTLSDFTRGEVSPSGTATVLNVDLTKSGAKRLETFTSLNLGKKLAFIVNGQLVNAPIIRDTIKGKGFNIGPMDKKVAQQLADIINSKNADLKK